MVTCTGHIGIHEGADGRTDVRTYVRTYVVRTDVDDVMAIKPNFLTSMGYHIFLSMVLRARAPSARAELRYKKLRSATNILGDFCYVQVNCKIESDMAGIQRAP